MKICECREATSNISEILQKYYRKIAENSHTFWRTLLTVFLSKYFGRCVKILSLALICFSSSSPTILADDDVQN
jgi:hypothetical protein